MAKKYNNEVSRKTKGKITKKPSHLFSRTESRILGASSKLDEFLLNPQVRTCSAAVPGITRKNSSENREPTGDRSSNDSCPEVEFSVCRTSNWFRSESDTSQYSSWSDMHILLCTINSKNFHTKKFIAMPFFMFFPLSYDGTSVSQKLVLPVDDFKATLSV